MESRLLLLRHLRLCLFDLLLTRHRICLSAAMSVVDVSSLCSVSPPDTAKLGGVACCQQAAPRRSQAQALLPTTSNHDKEPRGVRFMIKFHCNVIFLCRKCTSKLYILVCVSETCWCLPITYVLVCFMNVCVCLGSQAPQC